MFFAAGPQPAAFPPAQPGPALPPALARLGIQPPALPPGWSGVMIVRIGGDAPITVPLGEQATVGLPPMAAAPPARPAAAAGFGTGGLADLLRRLIGQGRIARTPAPAVRANAPFAAGPAPFAAAPAPFMRGADAPFDEKAETARLLKLVNAERAKHGAGPLTLDPKLNHAAHDHSADMAKRGFFGHDTPEGGKFFQRAAEAGTSAFAENIAGGQRTAESALAAWLNSPGHRRNLLNPAFTRMGAGAVDGRWTQMFG